MKSFQKLTKKAEKAASKENEKIERRRASLYPVSGPGPDQAAATDRRQSLGVTAFSSLGGTAGSGGTLRYSDLMGTVASRKLKGTVFSRIQKKEKEKGEDIFTVRDGFGTQRSLTGLVSGHQADIVFRDKEAPHTEDRETEAATDQDAFVAEPSSIFNRSRVTNTLALAVWMDSLVVTLLFTGRVSAAWLSDTPSLHSMHCQ